MEIDGIIKRFQNGDSEAFKELVFEYYDRILKLSYFFAGRKEEAKDLGHDIVLALHNSLGNFRFESKFDTYLYRVAFNTVNNIRRAEKDKWTSSIDDIADKLTDQADSPEKITEDKEIKQIMHDMILRLPAQLQDTVYLRYTEEKPYEEIAEILDCPVGTIMSRLNWAKQKLAKDIKKATRGSRL